MSKRKRCSACLELCETVMDRCGALVCDPCAEHFDNEDALREDELRQAYESDEEES